MPIAMILAAGIGERLFPLTLTVPKPLIEVKGKALCVYHIERLASIGVKDIVINTHYLAEKIQTYLGNGNAWGVNIAYSEEKEKLDTGGGIANALPLLGDGPFILVNSDVYTDYDFTQLSLNENDLARLVLVSNPEHHLEGDFVLTGEGYVHAKTAAQPTLTYAGIGLYHPALFTRESEKTFPLTKVLNPAIKEKRISGEHFQGQWVDVGTPARLESVMGSDPTLSS